MKKIVVPFEEAGYRRELLDFVRTLNDRSRVLLTATRHGARVARYCEEHGIPCRIHEDAVGFAPDVIRNETRFADLLLLSSCHFIGVIGKSELDAYMREVLHQAECPILLLPEYPSLPDELILAYDGSASSAYAIRQFAYLFPEFCKVKATLVCMSDKEKTCIPQEHFIRELCEQHYKKFRMLQLQLRTDGFYDTWIGMMNNPWLISGAFGHSDRPQLIHHNFVNRLVEGHRAPVFVAHR